MHRHVVLLSLVLLLTVGCAAPTIMINGAPADSHMMFFKSGDFTIYAQANRHYRQTEGQEEFIATEPVEFDGDVLKLPSNTVALTISLRIVNEKKHFYQIWETYQVNRLGEKTPTYKSDKVYLGKLSRNDVRVQCPIRDVTEGFYRLEMFDNEGDPQCVLGSLKYKWSGNGRENSRGVRIGSN